MRIVRRVLAVLLAVFLLVGCSGTKPAETGAAYKAGSYETTAKGFVGDITLKTTFTEEAIESIEVLSSEETPDIGGAAMEGLIEFVVANQSLNVDIVTGATITSNAFLEAVEAAVVEAGGDVEALKNVEVSTSNEPVNLEVDVVVIGGGGAGLSAAVAAASEGATVVLVEKTGALGGNTIRAGGPYNAVDPERQNALPPSDQASMDRALGLTEVKAQNDRHKEIQDELKADIEAYNSGDKKSLFDSNALHKLQTYDGGDYMAKLEFIEVLVDSSLDTLHWMEENGVTWTDDISTVPGGLWPRAHIPAGAAGGDYIKAFEATAKELGVQILLNSPATELIVEDGAVVGIIGTSNGQPMEIKAKSVVIATGGFSANVEMRQEYDPSLIDTLPTTNSPAITGDGIKMAEAVGANLIGMEYIQSLPLGDPINGGLNAWVGGSGVEYYYQINKDGVRFMAEDGRRDTMTQALLAQEDAMSYVISSAENYIEVEPNETIWGDDIDKLIADGYVFKADTIEELAEQIGVDPEVLKATHDEFNAFAEAGKDEDFGRTLFGKPLVTAPFFASTRVPTVHHTMGGIEITLDAEVLDVDGNVIPNLYAAGEVTGGIHGSNRLGGNALVDIHVFGRIAGTNAAANAK
jgi:fumarate reductase flavoprotein subunit